MLWWVLKGPLMKEWYPAFDWVLPAAIAVTSSMWALALNDGNQAEIAGAILMTICMLGILVIGLLISRLKDKDDD